MEHDMIAFTQVAYTAMSYGKWGIRSCRTNEVNTPCILVKTRRKSLSDNELYLQIGQYPPVGLDSTSERVLRSVLASVGGVRRGTFFEIWRGETRYAGKCQDYRKPCERVVK